MEAHTPKRFAVERFLKSHSSQAPGWQVRVVDEHDSPVILLEAAGSANHGGANRKLEIHTRQVSLVHDDVDESTKKMISRWLDSLASGEREAAGKA